MSHASLNESLGLLNQFSVNDKRLDIKCDNAEVKVSFHSDEIIHITIIPHGINALKHSYAVIDSDDFPLPKIIETEDKFTLQTDSLILEVSKDPVRFALKNADGHILNEDDSAFGTSWIANQVCTYKRIQNEERFIGLGEKVGPLDRRGRAFTNWNTDAFAYGPDTDPLYATTPFYIGIHNGLCYGVFMDNPAKSQFNFGASNDRFSSFSVEAGEMNYYLIGGNTPLDIVKNYSKLTGHMPLAPKWSLGLQQCRYSYYPESKIRQIARSYREKLIPCDVLYYDIHYMNEYKVFTWDVEKFPDPKQLNADLKSDGFTTVAIMDPGIKKEEEYSPYDEAKEKDLFLKYPDGENFSADVWPGTCHFPDFTKPEARMWWASKVPEVKKDGIGGYWNDMNEPACWGQSIPDLIEFCNEGDKRSHKQMRNVYGMQMARASYEGGLVAAKNERPFVLTRAAYSGIQRYAAVWTGDNVANDEHMLLGVRLVTSLGLAGIPFSGYDVGGFCGETSPELFARWFSIGALSPFFRCHKMINSADSEPWSYGEKVEEICRNYANLRYRLMSYIYSAFYLASSEAIPVQRSLTLEFFNDSTIYEAEYENQYLFGPSILVCPVASDVTLHKVYLPETDWYYLYNDRKYSSGQHIIESPLEALPLFTRAGSILPENSLIQHTSEKLSSELIVHLYKASSGRYTYTHYEDDDISFDYAKGSFFRCKFIYDAENDFFEIAEIIDEHKSAFKTIKLYLHGWEPSEKEETVSHRFIEPISVFDPFMSKQEFKNELKSVIYRVLDFNGNPIRLDF